MLIHLKNVSKIYGSNTNITKALDKVNFSIKKGEYVGILGPSGSGKSTLLHILGLLDKPTHGKVYFENIEVNNKSDDELSRIRRRKIGFVFQNFNLIRSLTVYENVVLPLVLDGQEPNEKEVFDLLDRIGILHRKDHYPNQISGGQMQRVAIARALIMKPDIILADEPTGNLDSKSGERILEIFNELHMAGRTIVVITHNKEVVRDCDRVIYIRDGKIEKEVKK